MILNKDARDFFKSKINNFNTSFCNELEQTLEELRESDFFGTEGQEDPRGDFRYSSEFCEECDGDGCCFCNFDGYKDYTDEMINIDESNVNKIIEAILSEDQKHNLVTIYSTYLDIVKGE